MTGLLLTTASFAGAWHWRADLLSHFRVQYAAVLALSAAVLFWRGRRGFGAAAMIGFLLNALIIVPHAMPTVLHDRRGARGPAVRCLSFNVLQGNERCAETVAFLRASGADAAVFQEITPEWANAFRELRDIFPHQLLLGKRDSKGAALLARHPVGRLAFDPLPGQSQIGAIIAEVEGPQPFTILGTHSHKPTSATGVVSQRRLFAWLAGKCADAHASGRPVVLMGDFNATPWCRAFRDFAAQSGLLDTSRGVTFGATWHASLPQRMMIDHGFVSPEWRLLARMVGPDLGSDHRPLILDLAVAR